MKEQKKLTIGMTIFSLIIFIAFGVIIVTEKTATYLTPKIEKKLTQYLNETYPNLNDEIKIENTTYKNTIYIMKVTSTKNKNLSFNIYYNNKKITDTYQEDYVEGKSFLKYISTNIKKEIKNKTNQNYKISITPTLNNFTTSITNKILKEENLSNLRIYTLEKTLYIENWTTQNISTQIASFITTTEQQNITPRTYTIIIKNNSNNIKITNITYKTIQNKLYNQIINDIITNNNSELLKQNKIKYEYIN